MIVVDTNIIAYLLLADQRSDRAAEALRRDPEWAAPILWRSELRNVLAHYIRRESLSVQQAIEIMDTAVDLLQGREFELSSRNVLRLVERSSCSAYDCEFVALAQDLGVPLITVDRQMLAQFPHIAVSLDEFVGSDKTKGNGSN